MRKRELDELQKKLELLKQQTLNNMRGLHDNIGMLNSMSSSEETDIGSVRQMAQSNKGVFNKNKKDLSEINKALEKFVGGKYGKCEMCGKQIDIKRLRVKPHARFCIACREIYEKQHNIHKRIVHDF